MKLLPPLLLFCIACAPLAPADERPFDRAPDVRAIFEIKTKTASLDFAPGTSDATLTFMPKQGEVAVLVYGEGGIPQEIATGKVGSDFCIKGKGSFGIYARGMEDGASAYLILLNQEGGNRGKLRVFKNPIWPQKYPEDSSLAQQDLRTLRPATWYRLEGEILDLPNGHTGLRTKLIEIETGSVLAQVVVEDALDPIQSPGRLALRLYADKKSDSHVEVKNFTFSDPK